MSSACIRLSIALLLFQQAMVAQNLVTNGDFEYYTVCPTNYSAGGPLEAVPWTSGNGASPDYYNSCCNACPVDVPANLAGYQEAHSGNAYAGLYSRIPSNWREYLQAPLISPLEAGATYYVEFYVSPAETICTTRPFGALFTVGPPPYTGLQRIDATPQVQVNGAFIDDFSVWTKISGCFVANGGEDYITIGNFLDDNDTPINPTCTIPPPSGLRAYYFLDDVFVEKQPTDLLDIELGDPVVACDFYTIDPGIPNVEYHWEDGSTAPQLTVFESGTYAVTISAGCAFGFDSIEVTIPDSEPVAIPDDEVSLCFPATYSIALDPDAGNYSWSDGSTGPNIVINESGTYAVTLDDGCHITSDEVVVNIIHAPDPFTLGPDAIICPNEEITYSFDWDQGTYIWQDGHEGADYTIFQEGEYSLTVSNQCGEETDEIEIEFMDAPDINLGTPDQLICDGDSIVFSLDPDQGDYLWQDGSDDNLYTIHDSGQYLVTVSNYCGSIEDSLNVTVQSIPSPDLGPDQLLCNGQSVVLTGEGNAGNHVWQDQSTDTIFLVTNPGTYSLTVTNGCGTNSDSVLIDFYPALDSFDLGQDISLCPGETIVLQPGVNNADYLWQDLSTADSLVIDQAGTYAVTVSNQCASIIDSVHVVLNNQPPDVELGAQVALCEGQNITLQAGISGVNYLWSDGTTASDLQVSLPGSYSLTVSNACGVDADTIIISDAGGVPGVSLGADISFCPGENAVLTPDHHDVITWVWQDGSADTSLVVSTPGVISVQVSNVCGTAIDTLIVTVLEATADFHLGADTFLCPGETLILHPDTAGLMVTWSDGTVGEELEVGDKGIYYATNSGVCGITSDTIEVDLLAPAPLLELGPDQSICPGDMVTIAPGLDSVEYLWQDGSVGETYSTTNGEEIILIVSNVCGAATDTLNIMESTDGPHIDLGPDVIRCEGDTVVLDAGIDDVDYLWQDGSVNKNIEATQSGSYVLQVSNNCGVDIDTVLVDLSQHLPQPMLGPDTTLCEGTSLLLYTNASAGTSIIWQDQSTSPQLQVNAPGLYTLQESNTCGTNSDSMVITYIDVPVEFDLGGDTLLCPGESLVLNAPATTDLITWQDGSHDTTLMALAGQLYSLVISNDCGAVSDEILVSADDRKPVIDLDETYILCPKDILVLDATQNFPTTYLWNTGSDHSSIEVEQPGEYVITITAPCQQLTDHVQVVADDDCDPASIFIPNIFSPNGDGINDVFEISISSETTIQSVVGTIYDRWGNVVYASSGLSFRWDGRFDDQLMMPGVYVYQMTMNFSKGGNEVIKKFTGDVTLIR